MYRVGVLSFFLQPCNIFTDNYRTSRYWTFSLYLSLDSVTPRVFLAKFFTGNGWCLTLNYWCTRSQGAQGKEIHNVVFSFSMRDTGWVTSFQIFSWNRNSCGATHAAKLVGLMPLGLLLQSQGFLTWCNKLSFQLFITFKDQQEVEINPQRFSSSLQISAFQILQITSIFLHLIVSFPWIHDFFSKEKNSPYFLSVYFFWIFIYFSKLK